LGSEQSQAKLLRGLVKKVMVEEYRIIIKVRRGALLGGDVPASASEDPSDSAIELTAPVAFKRRGVQTKLVLPGLAQQNSARCDRSLLKAIARGHAWFEELATGRARSLHELATRDGITRRYIRRLINLAFLSPELVEAILQGRQPVELTATRLTELDLPLDWTEQHRLLAI
jgi:site-specific DNA recombinase